MASTYEKHLSQKLAKVSSDLKTLVAEMETDESKRTDDNRQKVDAMFAEGKTLRESIENLHAVKELDDFVNQPEGENHGRSNNQKTFRTAGAEIVGSDLFQNSAKSGKLAKIDSKQFAEQLFGKVYSSPTGTTTSTTVTTTGVPIQAQRDPETYYAPRRPLSIIQLIRTAETTQTSIEQVIMYSRTQNASVVLDWDAAKTPAATEYGEKFGQANKGGFAFKLDTELVRDIKEWIPVHRNSLSDVPMMASLIDEELSDAILQELEREALFGTGSTEFTGILSRSGRLTRTHQSTAARGLATDTPADTIRRQITDLQLSFFQADAIVISPVLAEKMELDKSADGLYTNIYDPVQQRVWRVPVVINYQIGNTRSLVGSFQVGAKLFYRSGFEVYEGQPGDFFLDDAFAMMGKLRAAFTVPKPGAFNEGTGF